MIAVDSRESHIEKFREQLLIDPNSYRIETPVNEVGLVVEDDLFIEMARIISPDFDWRNEPADIHHLYPYKYLYAQLGKEYVDFRNLAVNQALLPVQVHWLIHEVVEIPAVPPEETIIYRKESFIVAKNLFGAASNVIRFRQARDRKYRAFVRREGIDDPLDLEFIRSRYENNLSAVEMFLEENEKLPAEFRLIELDPTLDIEDSVAPIVNQLARVTKRNRKFGRLATVPNGGAKAHLL